jgi:hypothetical protein
MYYADERRTYEYYVTGSESFVMTDFWYYHFQTLDCGVRGVVVAKELRYKPEGCGFEIR